MNCKKGKGIEKLLGCWLEDKGSKTYIVQKVDYFLLFFGDSLAVLVGFRLIGRDDLGLDHHGNLLGELLGGGVLVCISAGGH